MINNLITKKYIDKETLKSAALHFMQSRQIQLPDFLNNAALLKTKTTRMTKHSVPDKSSYSSAQLPSSLNFFTSEEFRVLISFITQQQLQIKNASIKMFEHHDYTLLYDDLLQEGTLVIFELTSEWQEDWGGYTSFVNDGEAFRIVPHKNALFIVDHKNLKHFVKYVNHHAKGKRIFVEIWME